MPFGLMNVPFSFQRIMKAVSYGPLFLDLKYSLLVTALYKDLAYLSLLHVFILVNILDYFFSLIIFLLSLQNKHKPVL